VASVNNHRLNGRGDVGLVLLLNKNTMIIKCTDCGAQYNQDTVNACPMCSVIITETVMDMENAKEECVSCKAKVAQNKKHYELFGNYCSDCSGLAGEMVKIRTKKMGASEKTSIFNGLFSKRNRFDLVAKDAGNLLPELVLED